MNALGDFWYCVECRARREDVVSQQLTRIATLEVFVPKIRVVAPGRMVRESLIVPMFPGYLFVKGNLLMSLSAIRYTVGVRDIVRFGDRIPIVPEYVIRELQAAVHEEPRRLPRQDCQQGVTVKVEEGTFEGFTGIVLRVDSARDRVRVLIELLGQSPVLDLPTCAVRVNEH
jgi:transcriptional antiterminator RfaH